MSAPIKSAAPISAPLDGMRPFDTAGHLVCQEISWDVMGMSWGCHGDAVGMLWGCCGDAVGMS
jgi:hypothetical protein